MTAILKIATRYVDAAISVIPIKMDGTKQPAATVLPRNEDGKPTWKPFQQAIATSEELDAMFGGNGVGVAIVCGYVSGNIECIDFDDVDAYRQWYGLLAKRGGQELLDRIVKVQTPRPGVVCVYRCPSGIESNQKLAQAERDGSIKTLIETRGEGGYFLAPGCPPQCHPTGRTYEVKHGDVFNPPVIIAAERALLLETARSLNEYVEPARSHQPSVAAPKDGDRPGDLYMEKVKWADILEPAGWKLVFADCDVGYWRRPDKKKGISATTNYKGSDLLYVFSTNAPHFQSENTYSKFAAYAQIHHRGDYNTAAKVLYKEGYKKERPKEAKAPAQQLEPEQPPDEARFVAPEHWQSLDGADVDRWDCEDLEWIAKPILAKGHFLILAAVTQTGKTLLGLHISKRLLTGPDLFGKFPVVPVEKLLYLMLEDPPRRIKARLQDQAREGDPVLLPGRLTFYFASGFKLNDDLCFQHLEDLILREKYEVVFIDTYQKATPGIASFKDEEQSLILHRIADMTRKLGVAVWVHDHFRKAEGGKPRKELSVDDIKGTGAKVQNADVFLLMDRHEGQLRIKGSSKDFDKPIGFLLELAAEGDKSKPKFKWTADLDDLAKQAKERGEETRNSILEALSGDWISSANLAAKTGHSSRTITNYLKILVSEKKLVEQRGETRKREYRKIGFGKSQEHISETGTLFESTGYFGNEQITENDRAFRPGVEATAKEPPRQGS